MIDAPLSTVTWEGEVPGVLLAHATGFCKELWGPVVDAMVPVAAVAFDQRGHGDSAPMPFPADWELIGADLADVAASADPQPRIAVGHSSGGAAAAIAAIADPSAFGHLVLIEPVITPPPHERRDDAPMALAAERRRPSFPDRTTAKEQLGRKGLFDRWHDEAVDLYLEHALRDEGGELVLKCSPATEAEHYRAGWQHPTWDHLDEIACPVTLIAGADSSTHHGAYLSALAGRFAEVEVIVVPEATHLVPMERPDVVAGAIRDVRGHR